MQNTRYSQHFPTSLLLHHFTQLPSWTMVLLGSSMLKSKKHKTSRSHMSGIFTTIASKPKRFLLGRKFTLHPGLTSSPSPSSVFAKSWPLIGWLLLVLNPGTFRPLPSLVRTWKMGWLEDHSFLLGGKRPFFFKDPTVSFTEFSFLTSHSTWESFSFWGPTLWFSGSSP